MQLGLIGLGKMGGNMAERLRRGGHTVVGFDAHSPKRDVDSLSAMVAKLEKPRVAWVMVPAGDPTESCVNQLLELLEPGDVLIEGGNSMYRDSQRRAESAGKLGIHFIDCGTSGGVWGLTEGYCLMYGGSAEAVAIAQPIFDGLAGPSGAAHVGPAGAGHFTKMVHNGVEYGMMQAYAEGWELLKASEMNIDVNAALELWRHGSVVRSWLLDLAVLATKENPNLDGIAGYANDSGEGRWTVNEAVRLSVPAPVLTAALYARFTSRQDDSPAMKMIAALRNQFGGHAITKKD